MVSKECTKYVNDNFTLKRSGLIVRNAALYN